MIAKILIFLIGYGSVTFCALPLSAEDLGARGWNQIYERLDALPDAQVESFLDSTDHEEQRAANLILKLRRIKRDWDFYCNQLKGASFQELLDRLESTNSTEIAAAVCELKNAYRTELSKMVPTLVQYAQAAPSTSLRTFLSCIEKITGAELHSRSEIFGFGSTDKYFRDLLDTWWREHRSEFETIVHWAPEEIPSKRKIEFRKRLEQTIIPAVDFRQADLRSVVDFLQSASRTQCKESSTPDPNLVQMVEYNHLTDSKTRSTNNQK